MNKILVILLVAYLAVDLSDGRKDELKEPQPKEVGFPTETLTILDSYRKNSLSRSSYLQDAFEPGSKLTLPAHLLVN